MDKACWFYWAYFGFTTLLRVADPRSGICLGKGIAFAANPLILPRMTST
jgi:hypothetical protein